MCIVYQRAFGNDLAQHCYRTQWKQPNATGHIDCVSDSRAPRITKSCVLAYGWANLKKLSLHRQGVWSESPPSLLPLFLIFPIDPGSVSSGQPGFYRVWQSKHRRGDSEWKRCGRNNLVYFNLTETKLYETESVQFTLPEVKCQRHIKTSVCVYNLIDFANDKMDFNMIIWVPREVVLKSLLFLPWVTNHLSPNPKLPEVKGYFLAVRLWVRYISSWGPHKCARTHQC